MERTISGLHVGEYVGLASGIVVLILALWSCVWVYKDANKKRKSGILLAILVFLSWPIGLCIWLLARTEKRD